MPYFSISLIIQIALVIHAIRNQKQIFWIFLLIFIPLIGSIAYVFAELIPDLRNSGSLRRGGSQLGKIMAPGRQTRELESLYEITPTIENMRNLADEYRRLGRHDQAIDLYQRCMNSPQGGDSYTRGNLAWAYLDAGRYEEALGEVQKLESEVQPDREAEYLLLHGKVLEQLNESEQAGEYFRRAADRGADLQYLFEYGDFLLRFNSRDKAMECFRELESKFQRLPGYAKNMNRRWFQASREAVKRAAKM